MSDGRFYDLFISYAHLDNRSISKGQEGWISSLHDSLEVRLGQLLGRPPRIWRDDKLRGNDEFEDEIILKFLKTKAFLAVISPCYLKSDWCMKELHEFIEEAATDEGIDIGSKSRIFKVVKTFVPHEQHPDEIRGLLGYDFFLKDKRDKLVEFSPERDFPTYQQFLEKLEDVACDICELIKEMDRQDASVVTQPESPLGEALYPEEAVIQPQGTGKIEHETGESFEQKVGEIFKLMGYGVEYNVRIAEHEINILITKKKQFVSKYEGYICECKNHNKKVTKNEVLHYYAEQKSVLKYFEKRKRDIDFNLMIVSSSGFTDNAKQTAKSLGVILKTYIEILSGLMDFDTYLTRLINDFEGSELHHLYIEPDFFSERKREVINSFKFVKEWLQQPQMKQFSLLGDHGTGKTSFAKVLTYKMAKAYKEESGKNRIPFLVDLQECKKVFGLKSLLQHQLKRARVKPDDADIFLKLSADGRVLLIFDAFDEMATMSRGEETLSNFKQLNQAVKGNAKVILISRTPFFRDKDEVDMILKKQGINDISEYGSILFREISKMPGYEIVHLREFSDVQVQKYLQAAMGKEWKAAYKDIKSIYNLRDLSYRPVLLDMIVKTLPKIRMETKEFNAVHLYEAYTKSWFEREEHRLEITKEDKKELMEGLAYRLWKEGKPHIHYSALADMINGYLEKNLETERYLEAAVNEVRAASFLVRDEGGNYSFVHGSFQEFFIARKIKKELLKNNFDILDLSLLSKEIVFFFKHLMENDELIFEIVIKLLEIKYRSRISENALFILYTVLKMVFLKQQFSLREDIEFSPQDVEAFKEKVQKHLPQKFNLKSSSLRVWNIPYMIFKMTDFTGAFMEDSVFSGTTFEDVEFNGTHMKGSDFSGSTFKNVHFKQVEAHHCDFKNCRFESCTIKDSDFGMSILMETVFESCRAIEGNDFTGAGFYHSDFDMNMHKNNSYLGAGVPETDTSKLSPVLVDQGHEDIIRTVVCSRDGRFLVSGGDDKTVKLWDLESGRLIKTLEGHAKAVLSVFISPNNRWIVSGSSDHTVKLWDIESGCIISTFKGHNDWVNSVFISPDNRRIVSGSTDQSVKLWDLENRVLIKTLEGHDSAVLSVFVSPDNRRIVSGGDDKRVKIWDLKNGKLIKKLDGHSDTVSSVFVSPDNRRIASCGRDKRIKLWDMNSGELTEKLEGHKDWVRTIFISADNQRLVSGSDDWTVKLWDLERGRLISTFEGHDNIVNSVLIRQDSRLMVSASFDKTIKVWDLEAGQLIQTLEGHKDSVHSDITNPKNLHRLYYRDRLALYPARDLPELRLKDF